MLSDFEFSFQYTDSAQNSCFVNILENKVFENDAVLITCFYAQKQDIDSYKIIVKAKKGIEIRHNEFKLKTAIDNLARIGCNGYQSWTESREFATSEKMEGLRPLLFPLMKNYGDYTFAEYKNEIGYFHSWTYGYIQQANAIFVGSLNEKNGFTCIYFQCNDNCISIRKDCIGLFLSEGDSYELLNFVVVKGSIDSAYETYFQLQQISPKKPLLVRGYTSWYLHYTHISQEILLKNLHDFQDIRMDYFQIDDGWQKAVGDWLNVNSKFENGMQYMASCIQEKCMKPGLWLAPFVCEKNSFIYREKRHWIAKDKKGKLVKAGYNPYWSGFFYALDIENEEVKQYLRIVFHEIIHEWKFQLLKIDFLYAVCIQPKPDKTKGQIMYEAMQFLREISHGAELLGCGVPLASCIGLVDYCRIGADIHLSWEHNFLKWCKNRERVSTILSLRNSVFRKPLSQHWFYNDPDVFLLRNENIHLTKDEKNTILLINYLFGDVLFTSDDISLYDKEQRNILFYIFSLPKSEILSLNEKGNILHIHCNIGEQKAEAYINFSTKPINVKIDGNKKCLLTNTLHYNEIALASKASCLLV